MTEKEINAKILIKNMMRYAAIEAGEGSYLCAVQDLKQAEKDIRQNLNRGSLSPQIGKDLFLEIAALKKQYIRMAKEACSFPVQKDRETLQLKTLE